MAALFKRKGSDIWHVDYVYRGKRYRKSSGTSDRKLAELHLKDIEVKIERENLGFGELNRKEVKFSEFIKEYLQLSKAEKATNTYLIDESALAGFKEITGDVRLSLITPKHGEDYKLKRLQEVKPVSVNIHLRQIKAALEKAVKWGYIEKNPLKEIKQCRVKNENLPEFLTKEEVKSLMDGIPEGNFKSFILFCLYTGCRRGEALNITWDDVDMERGRATLRITKTGKSRVVPINGALKRILEAIEPNGERLFPHNGDFVTHRFKKYVRASGIKNPQKINVHSLRHTFASHLVMAGVDLFTVSKLLGHSSARTTEMYAHLVPDHLKVAVERLQY